MPEVLEQINTDYAIFHFMDPEDNHIYKFESVSECYCYAWLGDHYILRPVLLYSRDSSGNVLFKNKDYKLNNSKNG